MTRILLAAPPGDLQVGLASMLSGQDGLELIEAAPDLATAIDATHDHGPDVVLIDEKIDARVADPVRAMREAPIPRSVRVVVLGDAAEAADVIRALHAGAVGYVLKDDRAAQILAAVRPTTPGGFFVSPRAAAAVLRERRAGRWPDRGG